MTTNIVDELIYADRIIIMNDKHEVSGIYNKEEVFDNLNLLKGFYIPFKFKLINRIGYNKLKDLDDKELLDYALKLGFTKTIHYECKNSNDIKYLEYLVR